MASAVPLVRAHRHIAAGCGPTLGSANFSSTHSADTGPIRLDSIEDADIANIIDEKGIFDES